MNTLKLSPISVNAAYRGRRFATRALADFKRDMSRLLPRTLRIGKTGALYLILELGVSARFDLDNGAKAIIDCLAEKYGFNDNRVHELLLSKKVVKKGSEYIKFQIEEMQI